jgi:hypothetical protein
VVLLGGLPWSIALTLAGERWITLASTPGFVERNGVRGRGCGAACSRLQERRNAARDRRLNYSQCRRRSSRSAPAGGSTQLLRPEGRGSEDQAEVTSTVIRYGSSPQPTAHRSGGRWTAPGWHERAGSHAARAASAYPEPAVGDRPPPPEPAPEWDTPCPNPSVRANGIKGYQRSQVGLSSQFQPTVWHHPRPTYRHCRGPSWSDPRPLGHVTHSVWQPVRLGLPPQAARTAGPPEGAAAPMNQSHEALLAAWPLHSPVGGPVSRGFCG